MHQQIQICQGTPNLSGSCLNRVKEDPCVFWNEGGANPSIGKLPRQFQVFWSKGCQINRQIWSRLRIRYQRLALTSRQRQLIDLAVVCKSLPTSNHAHYVDHLSCAL